MTGDWHRVLSPPFSSPPFSSHTCSAPTIPSPHLPLGEAVLERDLHQVQREALALVDGEGLKGERGGFMGEGGEVDGKSEG